MDWLWCRFVWCRDPVPAAVAERAQAAIPARRPAHGAPPHLRLPPGKLPIPSFPSPLWNRGASVWCCARFVWDKLLDPPAADPQPGTDIPHRVLRGAGIRAVCLVYLQRAQDTRQVCLLTCCLLPVGWVRCNRRLQSSAIDSVFSSLGT